MINITLKESDKTTDLSAKVQAVIEIDEQLDTSMDSGTIKYLTKEANSKSLNEALAAYSIVADGFKLDFVGMDSRALVRRENDGQGIYSHQVALTEPSKLLQGVMIDGLAVTQPEQSYGTKTESFSSSISSHPSTGLYRHMAKGSVVISNLVEIESVKGSIAHTTPHATYNEATRALSWSVMWSNNSQSYGDTLYTVTITYKYTQAASLRDVVERLLQVTPFDGQIFSLTGDRAILRVLHGVVSPQFKWNTQTTLWECLLQVGAVIDAIPRLVADSEGNYTVVTFDFVNAYNNYVDAIADELTNAKGESVNESQYNSALSAVVENVRENE